MKLALVLILLSLMIYSSKSNKLSFKKFKIHLNEYLENGTSSIEFEEAINLISLNDTLKGRNPDIEFRFLYGVIEYIRKQVTCAMCNMAANIAFTWVHNGESRDSIVDKIVGLCVTFNIQRKHVCQGVVDAHIDVLMWIIKSRKEKGDPVSASELCGLCLYPDCVLPEAKYEWKLDLEFLGPKPPVVEKLPPPEGSSALMVLQLTDFHLNPRYEPGSNAQCSEPTCCRAGQDKPPATDEARAGHWGDYRDCDAPQHAIASLMQNAKANYPDIAYVMFTGDVIDHVMWETSIDQNRESFSKVMNEIREVYPEVPLLPILGNHESHPLNLFTFERGEEQLPSNITTGWLYEEAAASWGAFLPADQKPTILKGGYYAYEVRPGLLVIALNNNFCYNFNWWLMYDNFDPADQLKWLAETLLKAEVANQKVHILSHIPMNSKECISVWRQEYQRIIHRFENTVVAQFHGHMHVDTFNIYYDPDDRNRATNIAFTGGSATAYQGVNPNYRVYTVDGDREDSSYRVLNYDTWYFNLTEANLAGAEVPPVWQKLYSFKEAYGLESMLPSELDKLVHKMINDTEMQDDYFKRSVAYADTVLAKGCDKKCKRELICNIVSSDNINTTKCNELIGPPEDRFIKDASNDLETLLAELELDEIEGVVDYDARKDKATNNIDTITHDELINNERPIDKIEDDVSTEGPKGEENSTEVQESTEAPVDVSTETEVQPGIEELSTEEEIASTSEEVTTEEVTTEETVITEEPTQQIPEEISSEVPVEPTLEEVPSEEPTEQKSEEVTSEVPVEPTPEEVPSEEVSSEVPVEPILEEATSEEPTDQTPQDISEISIEGLSPEDISSEVPIPEEITSEQPTQQEPDVTIEPPIEDTNENSLESTQVTPEEEKQDEQNSTFNLEKNE